MIDRNQFLTYGNAVASLYRHCATEPGLQFLTPSQAYSEIKHYVVYLRDSEGNPLARYGIAENRIIDVYGPLISDMETRLAQLQAQLSEFSN